MTFGKLQLREGVLLLLLLINTVCIAQIKGKVVSVADGDSFTLLTGDNKQVKIRLHGIDCPEKNAPFGTQAKAFTSKMIFGKVVLIKRTSTDRYRRTVGIAHTPEGKILNEELLMAGLAWHYKKHDKNPLWSKMEVRAREHKLGLWGLPDPTAPWDYRKQRKRERLKQVN